MPSITEGKLEFTFPDDWNVSKYEEWQHYKQQFIKVGISVKAVDVLANEPRNCCWLLEIKDYREHVRTKTIDLAEEISSKGSGHPVRLSRGSILARTTKMKKNWARQGLRAKSLKVVLHLQQPSKNSKLFPRAISAASVLQRLKQLIKAIDPHPRVVETNSMFDIPWEVTTL